MNPSAESPGKGPKVLRSEEAYEFRDSVKNPAARGGLSAVHNALLECYGFHFGILANPLLPEEPLDLFPFFQAVAKTFTEWTDKLIKRRLPPNTERRIVNKQKAIDYIESIKSDTARVGLRNFLTHLLSLDLPAAGPRIDLFFCCMLLAPSLTDPRALSSILDGSVAEDIDRLENDHDYWISCWFKHD